MNQSIIEYPDFLHASPDSLLSEKTLDELRKLYGSHVVLVGRFPQGLRATWVPIEIVDIGMCKKCLVEVDGAKLKKCAAFECDEEAALVGRLREAKRKEQVSLIVELRESKSREKADKLFDKLTDNHSFSENALEAESVKVGSQLVCALPLDGYHAFMFAEFIRGDDHQAERAIAQLESLSALSGWSSTRAMAIMGPLLSRLELEIKTWKNTKKFEFETNRYSTTSFYTHCEEENVFGEIDVARVLFDNAPEKVEHWPLDTQSESLATCLSRAFQLSITKRDTRTAQECFRTILRHPKTLACVTDSRSFEDLPKSSRKDFGVLNYLINAERWSQTQKAVKPTDAYVFCLAAACSYAAKIAGRSDVLFDPKTARKNLDMFLGGILDDLDLSQSSITGSGAMSAVLRPKICDFFDSHQNYLDSFYPATYTVADDPKKLLEHIRDRTWDTSTSRPPFKFCRLVCENGLESDRSRLAMVWNSGEVFMLTCVQGADIDIAVHATGKKFETIAHHHFAAFKKQFPCAVLERVERKRSCMFKICAKAAEFRTVEIYPATWKNICNHHLPIVRLAFTGAKPRFLLTATALRAAIDRKCDNFRYFLSRKVTASDIMFKYAARGYPIDGLTESKFGTDILNFATQSAIWNPSDKGRVTWASLSQIPPAVRCSGKYNLKALMNEIDAVSKMARESRPWLKISRPLPKKMSRDCSLDSRTDLAKFLDHTVLKCYRSLNSGKNFSLEDLEAADNMADNMADDILDVVELEIENRFPTRDSNDELSLKVANNNLSLDVTEDLCAKAIFGTRELIDACKNALAYGGSLSDVFTLADKSHRGDNRFEFITLFARIGKKYGPLVVRVLDEKHDGYPYFHEHSRMRITIRKYNCDNGWSSAMLERAPKSEYFELLEFLEEFFKAEIGRRIKDKQIIETRRGPVSNTNIVSLIKGVSLDNPYVRFRVESHWRGNIIFDSTSGSRTKKGALKYDFLVVDGVTVCPKNAHLIKRGSYISGIVNLGAVCCSQMGISIPARSMTLAVEPPRGFDLEDVFVSNDMPSSETNQKRFAKVKNSMMFCRIMWAEDKEFRDRYASNSNMIVIDSANSVTNKPKDSYVRQLAEGMILWRKCLTDKEKTVVRSEFHLWKKSLCEN